MATTSETLTSGRPGGVPAQKARAGRPVAGARNERQPDWRLDLPAEWRAMVVEPIDFDIQREYEIIAFRTLGFDDEATPCFYHHRYLLSELYSDDDDEYYEAIAYGEEVRSWRLRDDRWLIWRIVYDDDGKRNSRGFYSLSETMPR